MSKAISIKSNKIESKKHKDKYSIEAKLFEMGIKVSTGSWVINDRGSYFKIGKINREGVQILDQNDDESWRQYTLIKPDEFSKLKGEYIILDGTPEEEAKRVLEKMNDVESLNPNLGKDEDIDCHDIAPTMSKESLINIREGFELKLIQFEKFQRVLEGKKNALWQYACRMKDNIEKIQKVITVIELYLGIKEEIVEIKNGEQASFGMPISFRQQILFMDEEVGDPTDGGLDFKKIEQFDDWVIKPEHLNKLLPELRGVVIIKPRRYDKEYSSNWFENAILNGNNKRTYILIRNGERIYRINSENLQVDTRLFPMRDEFEEKIIKERHGYFTEEKVQGEKFDYKKNALMMQGLIDRTNVFYPFDTSINIFKPNTWKDGQIKFIHDDEMLLPPQKMYWNDWHKEINSNIQRGSRVYLVGHNSSYYNRRAIENYVDYQFKNTASWPAVGVYKVADVKVKEDSKFLKFVYNPGDTVWPGWGDYRREEHKRKKGITFTCNIDSDFILNYDRISLEDVEYYINSRVDRKDYLDTIPTLWAIKKERIKEIEWEKHFVKLVMDRTKVDEATVWKAINWWKYRNIWKRPIREDDAKALRMIERKAKNPKLWSKK